MCVHVVNIIQFIYLEQYTVSWTTIIKHQFMKLYCRTFWMDFVWRYARPSVPIIIYYLKTVHKRAPGGSGLTWKVCLIKCQYGFGDKMSVDCDVMRAAKHPNLLLKKIFKFITYSKEKKGCWKYIWSKKVAQQNINYHDKVSLLLFLVIPLLSPPGFIKLQFRFGVPSSYYYHGNVWVN